MAEVANHGQVTTVTGAVRDAVLQRMRDVHEAAASDVYAAIAEKFDTAAKRFVAAASTTDPEADAVTMIDQPDKVRKAWLDAEGFGNELSRLLPAVQAAAALAGIADAERDHVALPLIADLADCHRRRVWEAWLTTTGRTNRWGALLRAGAVLRCCPLEEHEWYAEPKAMEHREEPVHDETGRVVAIRRVAHDPEDSDYRPPPIDPRKPQKRVVIV